MEKNQKKAWLYPAKNVLLIMLCCIWGCILLENLGRTVLFEEEIPIKMWNLPVSELFMLGRKTVPKLYNLGIKTIGDLAKSNKEVIIKKFGKHGKLMWEYANGIDNSPVISEISDPKCISSTYTLMYDYDDINEINKELKYISNKVSNELKNQNNYWINKGREIENYVPEKKDNSNPFQVCRQCQQHHSPHHRAQGQLQFLSCRFLSR